MLQNIQNVDDKNVLYEMAVSNVNLGGVSYRVSRAELLKCGSEQDFAAKLQVIRLGFDRQIETCFPKLLPFLLVIKKKQLWVMFSQCI